MALGTLGKTLQRLSKVTNRLTQNMATCEVFVLRETPTSNGRGGTRKAYNPTTPEALPGFYSLLPLDAKSMDEQRANGQRKPVVYRRFLLQSTVDVKADDRLRLVATETTPEIELEVVKPATLLGLFIEVITAQEVPSQA